MITTEPWYIDPSIYQTLPQKGGSTYTLVAAGKSDFQKVNDLYQKSPVKGYFISQLQVVHNPAMSRQFEGKVMTLDARAGKPAFSPKWNAESEVALRTRVDQSLKTLTVHSPTSRNVLLFPAFHGTKAPLLDSIFETGFANLATTDSGFFGKGIYNTTHASYAHRVYSDGTLLFNWVAFFSAYPVTLPDMSKLQGGSNYSNYDAHYALVNPKNPQNPNEVIYLPITAIQTPIYDELVVFDSAHVLPRYLVTLSPEGLNLTPLTSSVTGLTLMMSLGACLPDAPLSTKPFLEQQIALLATHLNSPLTPGELSLFRILERTKGETDPTIKLTLFSRITKLIGIAPLTLPPPQVQIAAPQIIFPPSQPSLPPQAFGKAQWAKYFGDIGVEPSLPPDIQSILESPCPFLPGKKTKETHLLTLIPAKINGHLLTLNKLEELIQNPKQGHKTKYRYYTADVKTELGSRPIQQTHWVLMPRDVIPGSRSKSYVDQQKLVAQYPHYQVPQALAAAVCVLMEHVVSGTHLYGVNPPTCTQCEESVKGYQVVLGGFDYGGLNVDYNSHTVWGLGNIGVGALRKF